MENRAKIIIEAATAEAQKNVAELAGTTEQGFQRGKAAAEGFGAGVARSWQKAKAAWVEITAAVLALRKAYSMADTAAQFKERETAFANMAASHGQAADQIIADLKRMSGQTIDTMTIMEKAGTAMTMGIAADKLDEMMQIARASAKITGQTVSDAFSDISLAVGRQSKMILDNLGIIVRVEDANAAYAAQLGKTANELTDAEKKQAFLNATLKAGHEIVRRVGDQTDSAAERLQRYKARWTDAGVVIGKAVLTVAQTIELAFTAAGVSVNRVIYAMSESTAMLLEDLARIPVVGDGIGAVAERLKSIGDNAKGASDVGLAHMAETWDLVKSLWTKSEPVMGRINKAIEAQGESAEETKKKVAGLFKQFQEDADTRSEAVQAMYNDAGINADAYYRDELNNLVGRVKAWQDAGANIEDTEAYLFNRIEELEKQALESGAGFASDWLNQMKWHTDTMVADLAEKESDMLSRLQAIGAAVVDLDGVEIGIYPKLYDDAVVEGIDALIGKLNSLAAAVTTNVSAKVSSESQTASGSSSSGSDGGTTIVNNFNTNVSRSDVSNIVTEQARQAERG